MGIISQIRKNSIIIIVLIALGTGGFVVMDVVQNRNMMGHNTTIGTVDGKSLEYNQMRYMEEVLYQGSDAEDYSKKDYVWNLFLEQSIADNLSQKTGLDVGKEELMDLQFGKHLSPLIVSRFGNQQTGQVNIQQLNQIKQSIKDNKMPPELVRYWAIQEKEIIKDRVIDKLANMVSKAMYSPLWQTRMTVDGQLIKTDALAVKIPYTSIADNQVNLTDSDYERYLKGRESIYANDVENRSLSYVIIDASPTVKDSLTAKTTLENKVEAFKTAANDSTFVVANEGHMTNGPIKLTTLLPVVKNEVPSMAVGSVFGPYIEPGKYSLVKLLKKVTMPDSVKSRHIQIRAQTPEQFPAAEKRIDSIWTAIKSGSTSFDAAAKALSQDPGSAAKGGELGYVPSGVMVKPFNDAIFMELGNGQMKVVKTQFGYHLVEVEGRKFMSDDKTAYDLAFISEPIVPSEETQNAALEKAERLLQGITSVEQLESKFKNSQDPKLEKPVQLRSDVNIVPGVGVNQAARDIVKWLYNKDTKVGQVSQNLFSVQNKGDYYASKYVIAGLKQILPEGNQPLDLIKEQIKPAVLAMKKGEMITEKFKKFNSLEEIAANYNVKIDTLAGMNASTPFINKAGNEPEVVSAMTLGPLNKLSKPIIGNSGVFIGMPVKRGPDGERPNEKQSQAFYTNVGRNPVQQNIKDSLKKMSKIEDNRIEFF